MQILDFLLQTVLGQRRRASVLLPTILGVIYKVEG